MKCVPNQTGTILLKGVPVTNDQAGFAHLWRQLAETRIRLEASYKRFCIRRILQDWFPAIATDDWIFEICLECEQGGYDELPDPAVDWLPHRYFLLALIKPLLNDLGDCDAIDMAYSEVFPDSKPIYLTSRRQRMSQKRLAKAAEMGGQPAGEPNQEVETTKPTDEQRPEWLSEHFKLAEFE